MPVASLTFTNSTVRPLRVSLPGESGGLVQPGETASFPLTLVVEPFESLVVPLDVTTPLSEDGVWITPTDDGVLYGADGTWSFGEMVDGTNAKARMNGLQPNAYIWSGEKMQMADGLVHLLRDGQWWQWTPRRFTKATT